MGRPGEKAKSTGAQQTPVMLQHAAAKRAYPDAVVLFRLGDFYEMFGDDALLCSGLLNLTLTSRNKGKPDEVPMAGVPHHAAHGYIGRLLRAGHKVAICEQMADPSTVKGIVPRQVVRVLTPGTVTHSEHLEATSNSWLAALEIAQGEVGLALVDVSTGEIAACAVPDFSVALAEMGRIIPREILIGKSSAQAAAGDDETLEQALLAVKQLLPEAALREDAGCSPHEIDEQLSSHPDAQGFSVATRAALARILRFVQQCQPGVQLPLRALRRWNATAILGIDPTAQSHLELVRSLSGQLEGTLLSVLDLSTTVLGARLLRRRLLAPLLDIAAIRRRLDLVELFVIHLPVRQKLRTVLALVSDLERLAVRAALGEANPRDLGSLRDGLLAAAQAVELLLRSIPKSEQEPLQLSENIDLLTDLSGLLANALVDKPPAQAKEGSIFRPEFDHKLRELDTLCKHGTELIVALEERLRQDTGITTLKIRNTRVFGWYLEVSKSHLGRVPADWRRKQTIAGGERYTLTQLDDLADKIASAEEEHRARELQLLKDLLNQVAAQGPRIARLAERVAELDCAAALAEVAHRYDYCRPLVDDSALIEIEEGRHPVVERLAASGRFVPNDTQLDLQTARLWIITGPNMAGKSTYLRQTALIALMAQMGSFVPAKRAHVGVVDHIFSRVGASDNLSRGESTFMVEMRETSQILRNATSRSLVVLDEIGRGTSTFDGLAIAWAVAEFLDAAVQCRALFATHYHELTALADGNPHVANYSVSAREMGNDIVFLHRLVKGAASRSYGVAVARLAGLPRSVLARAQAMLKSFEGEGAVKPGKGVERVPSNQMPLFQQAPAIAAKEREALASLQAFDVENSTPLEALQLIEQLKKRL